MQALFCLHSFAILFFSLIMAWQNRSVVCFTLPPQLEKALAEGRQGRYGASCPFPWPSLYIAFRLCCFQHRSTGFSQFRHSILLPPNFLPEQVDLKTPHCLPYTFSVCFSACGSFSTPFSYTPLQSVFGWVIQFSPIAHLLHGTQFPWLSGCSVVN